MFKAINAKGVSNLLPIHLWLCSAREFINRFQTGGLETGTLPMLASACPGM